MRTVVLLGVLLVWGSMPVYAQKAKGVQHIASAVKGKVGHVLQWGATGAIASMLLFTVPTGVEAGQPAEAVQQAEKEKKVDKVIGTKKLAGPKIGIDWNDYTVSISPKVNKVIEKSGIGWKEYTYSMSPRYDLKPRRLPLSLYGEVAEPAEPAPQAEIEAKSGIDWEQFRKDLDGILERAEARTDAILGHRTEQYYSKMQQLIDGLQADAGQIVTAKLRFPFPDAGLLDNLPASVRKLEVSRIKRDLRSLMTQIDAIALPMGQADDLFAYFYGSGKDIEKVRVMTHAHLLAQSKTYRRAVERLEKEALRKRSLYTSGQANESVKWYSRAHGVSAKGLSTNPSNTDAALLYLRVQYDKAVALAQEIDSGETDRKSELAIELGILQERAERTLRVIEKTERNKAKQRRRLWRFGR